MPRNIAARWGRARWPLAAGRSRCRKGPTMTRAPRAATRVVLIAVGATVAVLAIVAVSFHRYQQDNLRADLTTAGQSVAAAVDNMATMGDTSPAKVIAASTSGKGTLKLRATAAGTTFVAGMLTPAITARVNAGAHTITLTSAGCHVTVTGSTTAARVAVRPTAPGPRVCS